MTHGFDLNSPLICEGVIGDGCGGGRLFMVEDEVLKAFDPLTKEIFVLLEDVLNAVSVSKSACLIKIVCKTREIRFDLSLLEEV